MIAKIACIYLGNNIINARELYILCHCTTYRSYMMNNKYPGKKRNIIGLLKSAHAQLVGDIPSHFCPLILIYTSGYRLFLWYVEGTILNLGWGTLVSNSTGMLSIHNGCSTVILQKPSAIFMCYAGCKCSLPADCHDVCTNISKT